MILIYTREFNFCPAYLQFELQNNINCEKAAELQKAKTELIAVRIRQNCEWQKEETKAIPVPISR